MRVLTEEYINPFDLVIEKNELFNLSSGVPLLCTDLLNCWDIGQSKFERFTQESVSGNLKPFHDPTQKKKITMFKDMTKSTKVANNGKSAVIDANRNILQSWPNVYRTACRNNIFLFKFDLILNSISPRAPLQCCFLPFPLPDIGLLFYMENQ